MPSSRAIFSTVAACFAALLLMCPISLARGEEKEVALEVRVARWKDDRTGVFLLMFDDSWPSHWQVAAPELVKRGMTATFYVCPGKGEHQKFEKEWNEVLWKQGMAYGVHTMTHKGVTDLANAEWEIGECAQIIRTVTQTGRERLLSYGQPGVGPNDWNITEEQLNALLRKHHLVSRPTFVGHGAVYHVKTAAEMLALADRAIAAKGMEYLVIHGVERITPDWGYQDMWPLKQEIFFALLDGLKQRRDQGKLWITDHISMHQYETERNSAEVKIVKTVERGFHLELKSSADPQLYNLPLTLIARVPGDWQRARVTQNGAVTVAEVQNGMLRFDAVPGNSPVIVEAL